MERNIIAADEIPDRHPEDQVKQQSDEVKEAFEVETPQATKLENNVKKNCQH